MMEVRPGYKETEVGVIPEEWNYQSIGDILRAREWSVKTGPLGT